MPVVKRKIRLVTFRVTEEEYEQMENACRRASSRSISDFARNAVVGAVRIVSAPQGLLTQDLSMLTAELMELDSALRDLRSTIQRIVGAAKNDRGSGGNHGRNP